MRTFKSKLSNFFFSWSDFLFDPVKESFSVSGTCIFFWSIFSLFEPEHSWVSSDSFLLANCLVNCAVNLSDFGCFMTNNYLVSFQLLRLERFRSKLEPNAYNVHTRERRTWLKRNQTLKGRPWRWHQSRWLHRPWFHRFLVGWIQGFRFIRWGQRRHHLVWRWRRGEGL